ncbi:MAG: ArsR family transcriptional regulator [Fervidicoccaceae archaeon]|nr:ArsR family transcriptional regulator [Fervidicoccaceae archaeon]
MSGENLEVEFRKQLLNFINALIALAPSRNMVTQFLYLVWINGSIDYRVLEDAYPDIVKDEYTRDLFGSVLGVRFEDKVSLVPGSYGEQLCNFVKKAMELFENKDFSSIVGSILKNEYPQGLPNLSKEWLDVRIRGLSQEPTYGELAIKVLKEIIKYGKTKVEELERILGKSRGTIIEALKLLRLYGLVIEYYDKSYAPSNEVIKYTDILGGY